MSEPVKQSPPAHQPYPPRQVGPGRTPGATEGDNDQEQRRMPQQEPGATPGSAEGPPIDDPPSPHR